MVPARGLLVLLTGTVTSPIAEISSTCTSALKATDFERAGGNSTGPRQLFAWRRISNSTSATLPQPITQLIRQVVVLLTSVERFADVLSARALTDGFVSCMS